MHPDTLPTQVSSQHARPRYRLKKCEDGACASNAYAWTSARLIDVNDFMLFTDHP